MTVPQSTLIELGRNYLYPNYRQPDLVLSRGKGSELWDIFGKRYLDLYAGIAVSTLGHGHPRLAQAIAEQAATLIHTSNYFFNEKNVQLAERLCRLAEMDRAFFCNSGTEAIEAALKLARRYFYARGEKERYQVLAFKNSFHGRTLGALTATGQDKYREGFGPLTGVTHVPFGDLNAVKSTFNANFAAIIVEPVQGEGGVLPAPAGFLQDLRKFTEERGALLIIDEVQTGVGRTGRFLSIQHDGLKADIVCLAKALAGGVPIGAMLAAKKLEEALPPGSHGSTFGGNPLASAAALAVLDALETDGLMQRATELGNVLGQLLQGLVQEFPKKVEGARGRGLLQALLLRPEIDARAVLVELQQAGVLLTLAGGQGLRFSPALTIQQSELEEGVEALRRVLKT